MRYHSHKGCYYYGSDLKGGTPFHAPAYVVPDHGYMRPLSSLHHEVPGQGCLPISEGLQEFTAGAVEKYPLHDLRYDANGNMTSTELDHFNGAIAGRVME